MLQVTIRRSFQSFWNRLSITNENIKYVNNIMPLAPVKITWKIILFSTHFFPSKCERSWFTLAELFENWKEQHYNMLIAVFRCSDHLMIGWFITRNNLFIFSVFSSKRLANKQLKPTSVLLISILLYSRYNQKWRKRVLNCELQLRYYHSLYS